jgi:hypothetical protein
VFFHEFGEHGILALQLGLELLDFLELGILGGFGLSAAPAAGEGEMAVLEELFEPVVNLVGVEIEFIAEIGDGNLVEEVPFEDGDLLRIGEVTAWLAHEKAPFGLC